MEDEINRIAEIILSGGTPAHDAGLLSGTVKQLSASMAKGYTRPIEQVKWDTPDADMIDNLTRNIYQFSAAKNWQQLHDMTSALRDGERIVSESEFFDRINAINDKYNKNWLRTERNSAIAGAQMASRWAQFQNDKEAIPLLTYRTVGDSNVRPAHQALDGITRPIDDTFWKTNYPPNGWGCRCDVEQAPGRSRPTPKNRIPNVPIPEMFKTNLAEAGLIYPKEHPYYNGVPNAEIRKAIAWLPPDNTYHRVLSDNGMPIEINVMHNKTEIPGNTSVANDLCKAGYKDIYLLPDIHAKDAHLRKRYLPDGYKQRNIAKNPDAVISDTDGNKMVCDFKIITGERNFAHRIAQAAEQADYAVIKLDLEQHKLGNDNIRKIVDTKMVELPDLKGVIVINRKGEVIHKSIR